MQNDITEHESLIAEWTADSKIDRTKLLEEMYRSPIIHSKYISKLQEYRIKLRKRLMKLASLRALKVRYFNGELSEEELIVNKWKPYQFKRPLKSEMDSYLSADADLQKIENDIEYLQILIQTCESIMKEIHSRNFVFKTIVEYTKFEAGA